MAGAAVGVLLVFLCAATLGLVLHLNRPASRRAVMAEVNAVLASSFRGTVSISASRGFGVWGIDGLRVRVKDPGGAEVLFVDNLRLRVSGLGAVRSALFGSGDIAVDVSELSIFRVDLDVGADADGVMRVQHAVESREPSAPTEAAAAGGGRGVSLALPFSVDLVDVHGQMKGAPPLDVELGKLRGNLTFSSEGVSVVLQHLDVEARHMPMRLDAIATLTGSFAQPAGGALEVAGSFEGTIGQIPVHASGSLQGTKVDGEIDVPSILATRVRELLPEAPLHHDVALHAEVHGDLSDLEALAHLTIGKSETDITATASLGDAVRAKVKVDTRGVDLRAFAPTAPASTFDAKTTVSIVMAKSGEIDGDYMVDLEHGDIAGQVLPGCLSAESSPRRPVAPWPTDRERFRARGQRYAGLRRSPRCCASFALRADIPRLDAVPRAQTGARGRADVAATGSIRYADASLAAELDATLDGIAVGDERVAHAQVHARAQGPANAPQLEATVSAEGLLAAGLRFARAEVTAKGTSAQQDVGIATSPARQAFPTWRRRPASNPARA